MPARRMSAIRSNVPEAQEAAQRGTIHRVELVGIDELGCLLVRNRTGSECRCECLASVSERESPLVPGDRLLAVFLDGDETGIVLGRIGKYRPPEPAKPEPNVIIEATETLTLKCGEASVDLRKDGKVMVRGEDVLLRAKKTQRIKAGTVAIN